MFRARPSRLRTALSAAACAAVLSGLIATDAAADGHRHGRHKHKHGRGHRHETAQIVRVEHRAPIWYAQHRYVPRSTRWRVVAAPRWCSADRHVVFAGNPYWYHVGLGAYFGGVNVNLQLGSYAPDGYGYWDPYGDAWIDSVESYVVRCRERRVRPIVQVVSYGDLRRDGGRDDRYGYDGDGYYDDGHDGDYDGYGDDGYGDDGYDGYDESYVGGRYSAGYGGRRPACDHRGGCSCGR